MEAPFHADSVILGLRSLGVALSRSLKSPITRDDFSHTFFVAETCRDQNYNCGNWARRGECYRNPRYMRVYCKKSCRVCNAQGKFAELFVIKIIIRLRFSEYC